MSGESSRTSRTTRRAAELSNLVARLAHDLHASLQQDLTPLELTVPEFQVLAALEATPGLTAAQVARQLRGLGRQDGHLTLLETEGLIVTRLGGLYLTERGELALRIPLARVMGQQAERFAHLSATEQARLAALLRKALNTPERSG